MFKTSGLWILCYKLSGHAYDEESHNSDLSSILSCGTGVPFSGACIAPVCVSYEFTFLYLLGTLGSCSNGDVKGNKNVKRATSLIRKATISRVTCSALFGFFPCCPFTSMTSDYLMRRIHIQSLLSLVVMYWLELQKSVGILFVIYCLGDNCENAGRAYFCQFIRLLCKVSWAKRDYLFWLFILYRRLSMTFHHM